MRWISGWIAAVVLAFAGGAQETDDVALIQAVVTSAYVEGVHAQFSPDAMRGGFHPDFVMYVNAEEGVGTVALEDWITRMEDGAAANPDRPQATIDHAFSLIEITGDTALARVELHRDGVHTFTDYLSLYRTVDGWRIVAKVFERHS